MAGKLKPLEVARLITPGKHADGDGLYLVVASATARNWCFRYWIHAHPPNSSANSADNIEQLTMANKHSAESYGANPRKLATASFIVQS